MTLKVILSFRGSVATENLSSAIIIYRNVDGPNIVQQLHAPECVLGVVCSAMRRMEKRTAICLGEAAVSHSASY